MKVEELINTVYAESDFSRSVATTLAGVSGLLSYIWKGDWVVAAFIAIIVFPVSRVIVDSIHVNWVSRNKKTEKEAKLREQFDRFSPQEKQILRFFVKSGGVCVSWGFVNRSQLPFPRPALNSLMERRVVRTSVMEDGMTESFVLEIDVFDLAQKYLSDEF